MWWNWHPRPASTSRPFPRPSSPATNLLGWSKACNRFTRLAARLVAPPSSTLVDDQSNLHLAGPGLSADHETLQIPGHGPRRRITPLRVLCQCSHQDTFQPLR